MGVDLIVDLVVGVPIDEAGADGRSFSERFVSGEFGEVEPEANLDLPSALEAHFGAADDLAVSVFGAFNAYAERRAGMIVGVLLAEVHNRGTPRNLGGGLTEAEFDTALQEATRKLRQLGISRPRLWLVQRAL